MKDDEVLATLFPKIANRIELIPGQPVQARYLGPHAKAVLDLFATNTVPCPWDSRQPREDILREIQKRNPGTVVYWQGSLPERKS